MQYSGTISGSKPILTTPYTSGSGTFTPTATNSWCRITMVGGGGGGGRGATTTRAGGGGGAGATQVVWRRMSGAVTYFVGAAGSGATANNTAGTAGSDTKFDGLIAPGGKAGPPDFVTQAAYGGLAAGSDATGVFPGAGYGMSGGAGGVCPNDATNTSLGGRGPGFPMVINATAANVALYYFPVSLPGTTVTNIGGSGGGSSVYGKGGNGGNGSATTGAAGSAGTGYGAGGGGGGGGSTSGNGGDGTGGYILVEEFGVSA